MTPKEVPQGIRIALGIYHSLANRFRIGLVILGVTAVGCSLFVTAFAGTEVLSTMGVKILSFISIFFITIITTFNIASQGNKCRYAFRHLLYATELYEYDKLAIEDLLKAHKEAEEMLGAVDFNYNIRGAVEPINKEDKKG